MEVEDWSFVESPELTVEARRILDALLIRIHELESGPLAPPIRPHPDSTLAGDDRAMAPFHVSATASTPLVVALDHLSLHRDTMREVSPLRPLATYTLLRPAIEGAAWAIWILSPTRREDRLLRALQYMYLDQAAAKRLIAVGGGTPEHSLDALKDELAGVAGRQHAIPRATLFEKPSARSAIEIASREVGVDEALAVKLWMALSALAHGRSHGIMLLLQREELGVGPHGEVELRAEASLAIIASATKLAVAFVETALNLYASGCSDPNSAVPPA